MTLRKHRDFLKKSALAAALLLNVLFVLQVPADEEKDIQTTTPQKGLTYTDLVVLDAGLDCESAMRELQNACMKEHQNLLREGVLDKRAHGKIDEKYRNIGKRGEAARKQLLEHIFGDNIPLSPAGRDPAKTAGIYGGDIDTNNMSEEQVRKIRERIKKIRIRNPDGSYRKLRVTNQNGYMTIEEAMTTVHYEKNPHFNDYTGKESMASLEVGPDGKLAMKKGQPVVRDEFAYVMDNIKKMGKNVAGLELGSTRPSEFKDVCKAFQRIADRNPEIRKKYPDLYKKCADVYKGNLSPESVGLTDKAKMDDFRNRLLDGCRDAADISLRKSEVKGKRLAEKFQKARDAQINAASEYNAATEEYRKTGDKSRLKKASEKLKETRKAANATHNDLSKHYELRHGVKKGVMKNCGPDALDFFEGNGADKIRTEDGGTRYRDRKTGKIMTESEYKRSLSAKSKNPLKKLFVKGVGAGSTAMAKISSARSKIQLFENGVITKLDPKVRPGFKTGSAKIMGIAGIFDAANVVIDTKVPETWDPYSKAGAKALIGLGAMFGITQSVAGGAALGQAEWDKWKAENPGKIPSFLETQLMGLRAGNRLVIDTGKGLAKTLTGLTVMDLYDSYSSYSKFSEYAGLTDKYSRAVHGALGEGKGQIFEEAAKSMAGMKEEAGKILSDPRSSRGQKEKARKLLAEIENTKTHFDIAVKEEESRGRLFGRQDRESAAHNVLENFFTRSSSLDVDHDSAEMEERVRTYRFAMDRFEKLQEKYKDFSVAAESSRLAVKVVDNEGGGIAGAVVMFDGKLLRNARRNTNSSGYVSFDDVPSGAYKLTVWAEGYESFARTFTLSGDKPTVKVKVGMVPKPPEMPLYARLSVYAVDAESGGYIPGAKISIDSPEGRSSLRSHTGGVTFDRVARGRSTVSASAEGYLSKTASLNIDPSAKTSYSCMIRLAKGRQTTVDPKDTKSVFDNTYVQTDDGIKRRGDAGNENADDPLLLQWRKEFHRELEKLSGGKCPNCGGTPLSALIKSWYDEDIFRSEVFCSKCGWRLDMAEIRKRYNEIRKLAELKKARKGEESGEDGSDGADTPPSGLSGRDEIIKWRDNRIQQLRAEGNAILDNIRAELKKMEGKKISKACHSCGNKGPHPWDGSDSTWWCTNCSAVVMQPSEYPTSSGVYKEVKNRYLKRIEQVRQAAAVRIKSRE